MTDPNRELQSATEMGVTRPSRKKKRKKALRITGRIIGGIFKLLGTLLLIVMTTGVLLACFGVRFVNDMRAQTQQQEHDYLSDISLGLTSTMYYTDENGELQPYLTLSSAENRVWVKYEDLPPNLVKALVAIEDKRFWEHEGVDWIRTGRGVLNMFTGGSIQGGSTITQQLIKNSTGENQVTVKRKISEIFRALEFEKTHSKEQILEGYLNLIYLGERCYGVGSASWAYFGKDVRELSLAQCASLVGITNNPSRYDPYLNKSAEVSNDAANRKRAKLVLDNMLEQEMISQKEHDAACKEVDTMEFIQGSAEGGDPDTVYTWYQDQVIKDVAQDLMSEYGWSEQVALHKIYYGGLSIHTNVDLRVQGIVDEIYSDPSVLPYVSNSGQPLQSAITVVDHQGRVVAISGGIGEKVKNRAWSRASSTLRPPGSSIKPLAVYSQAIEMGYITPYTIIDDAPYMELNEKPYPANSTRRYNGLTTVARGVASSTNTIAVRVLGDYVTPQASYAFLEDRYHISSLVWEKWINDKKFSDIGLPQLALGGLTTGVSTYEMAAAYSVFPTMGRYVPPRTYSKVIDSDGMTVLLDRSGDGEYVIKESTAYYMNTMLRGVVTGGTGGGAAFNGMTIAGKTGTTTSKKDVWFVGYTPYYTAAVWVGYDRQEMLVDVGNPHTYMWNKVMSRIHEGLEDQSFPLPSDVELVMAEYCLDSGMKPCELCYQDTRGSRVVTGTFVKGDEPKVECDRHVELRLCVGDPIINEETGEPMAYRLAGEFCPEELVVTVSAVDYVREGIAAEVVVGDSGTMVSGFTDGEVCQVHTSEYQGEEKGFDPADPSTWPVDDPLFDITDPTTWPPVNHVTPEPSPGPGGEPTEPPAVTEPPTESGPPELNLPPDDTEPYVPAGIGP